MVQKRIENYLHSRKHYTILYKFIKLYRNHILSVATMEKKIRIKLKVKTKTTSQKTLATYKKKHKLTHKLTPIQIYNILVDYFINKKTLKEIANKYGVNIVTVSRHVRKYTNVFTNAMLICGDNISCIQKNAIPEITKLYHKRSSK